MMRELDRHLASRDWVVLYGHPCYEGVRDGLLARSSRAVLEHGFRFVTMQSLAERLQAGAAASMIRVLSVFGTRPEAIKMAPVVQRLRRPPARFQSVVCVSAQHRAMLDQVLEVFASRADHDLDLMTPGQTPAEIAGPGARASAAAHPPRASRRRCWCRATR